MLIRTKKGLDLPIAGKPEPVIHPGPKVEPVAMMGDDYIGLRPTMHVEQGQRVKLGEPVFSNKKNPGVVFSAPGAGIVESINRGAKRVLQSVVIRLDGDAEVTFTRHERARLSQLAGPTVQSQLIAAGLWPAFRTRPFSKVPKADSRPASIFVTAVDSNPLAAQPEVIIAEYRDDFVDGLNVIAHLTKGPVFVCCAPDTDIPAADGPQFQKVEFAGPHPSGLVGTHIHFLDPVDAGHVVWHIGYQDVIAVGRLFTTGRIWTERVIAMAGPKMEHPRLIRTRLGANTEDLLRGELRPGRVRVISGPILSGRRAAGWATFLRRYHLQISALQEGHPREFMSWIKPGFGKYSAIRAYAGSILRSRPREFDTSQNGSPRAMVPIGNFEPVMPLDILPAPLLRALIVQDTDTAQALGCLELDEEDLALCSFVCASKYEYGEALRENLTVIEKEG
jgi:Na+-transporting NADH:ubiquinone oxidoreductase subunit A